jgi:large subunit ribosomal protein L24
MNANQSVTLRIKKDDTVVVLAGREKGKTGKVLRVFPQEHKVTVEGVNIITKHVKPSQLNNNRGSIEKIAQPIPVSKVAIAHPTKEGKGSRIGYEIKKDGTKVRVYRQAANKEIK